MFYGKDAAGKAIENVASVQKSMISILVSIAQEKGLLKLSDLVSEHLGDGWSKATVQQERKITVRHLMAMTSALTEQLTFTAEAGTRYSVEIQQHCVFTKPESCISSSKQSTQRINHGTAHWLTGSLAHWECRTLSGFSEFESVDGMLLQISLASSHRVATWLALD